MVAHAMIVSITLLIRVTLFVRLQTYAYQFQTIIPFHYGRLYKCQNCLQRFVSHGTFTYDIIMERVDPSTSTLSVSLEIIAEITDDIPLSYIKASCLGILRACYPSIRENHESEFQEKRGFTRLSERGTSDMSDSALKKVRLFGVDMTAKEEVGSDKKIRVSTQGQLLSTNLIPRSNDNWKQSPLCSSYMNVCEEVRVSREDSNGGASHYRGNNALNEALLADTTSIGEINKDGSNSRMYETSVSTQVERKTHCLLLQVDMWELWIHACLQCLVPGSEVARFMITKASTASHRWVVRYTTADSPITTMEKCSQMCGAIRWGSEADCLVAELYTMTQVDSVPYSDGLEGFSFTKSVVAYLPDNKDLCLSCLLSAVSPSVIHIESRGTFSVFTTKTLSQSAFTETFDARSGVCKIITESAMKISKKLPNFLLLSPAGQGTGTSILQDEWTTPYHCIHYTASPTEYENVSEYSKEMEKELSRNDVYSSNCLYCLLQKISATYPYASVHSFQPTSHFNSLIFLTKAIHVHAMRIACQHNYKWVTGLSDTMCKFLSSMVGTRRTSGPDVARSTSSKASTSTETSLYYEIAEGRYNSMTNIRAAVKRLGDESSNDFVWFIQFEMGEYEKREALKDLILCIAAVSSVYVLSTKSWYILTSRFDYIHVDALCELPSDINVIVSKKLKIGFNPQPLRFSVITSTLGFSEKNPPRDFIRSNLKRTRFLLSVVGKSGNGN